MANSNWVSWAEMNMLEFHTGPAPTVYVQFLIIYRILGGVEWLDAVCFDALEYGPPGVEKRVELFYSC